MLNALVVTLWTSLLATHAAIATSSLVIQSLLDHPWRITSANDSISLEARLPVLVLEALWEAGYVENPLFRQGLYYCCCSWLFLSG